MGLGKPVKIFLILIFLYDGQRKFVSSAGQNDPAPGNTELTENKEKKHESDNRKNSSARGNATGQFNHGVGGHKGMMEDVKGFILKPVVHQKEIDFYETLQKTTDTELQELKQLSPTYGGKFKVIRIEDLTQDFEKPCVMDLKIGDQTWEPNAPEDKVLGQKAKCTEMRARFAFCIIGYQYYDVISKIKVKVGGKSACNNMKPEEGLKVIYSFVNGKQGLKSGLVDRILEQLRKIESWFEHQRRYHFFGSSILIAYDAHSLDERPAVRVRMIDFGHALPNEKKDKDENYLQGLRKLIEVLKNMENAPLNHSELPAKVNIVNDEPGTKTIEVQEKEGKELSSQEDVSSADINKVQDFVNQLGGHHGMMKDENGLLLKRVNQEREINFYEELKEINDPVLRELKSLVPMYFGHVTFIRLEDLTNDLVIPCIMDIKIGFQTWEPTATEKKISTLVKHYTQMRGSLSFGIPGFKYYDIASEKEVRGDRAFGHNMAPSAAIRVLYNFVNAKLGLKSGLVDSILEQLRRIRAWFERQRHYHFYGSSILITYDADALAKGEDPKVRVRMIDFAHALPITEKVKDENYIDGLDSLINILANLEERQGSSMESE